MPTSIKYPTSKNAVQKTLDAALLTGVTAAVTLNSVVGIQNKAGVFVVDRVDSNGVATPSKREYITFTGVSGSTLTTLTRNADGGGTDQDHAVGAIVEFVSDVLQEQAIIDGLLNVIDTTGALDTTKVVDLTTAQTLTNKILSTGTSLDANADINFTSNSLYRQALINGNFDVWQRGTTGATIVDGASSSFVADRWGDFAADDGGTLPTLTRTRETLTAGDIFGSFYYSRLTTNGAGTSLGTASRCRYANNIEHGTRILCGASKTVTLSFYARSSISSKKLTPVLGQSYGTGGSPSSSEYIVGSTITLTSSWAKYTQTFTTSTLVGKTFGTANDDFLQVALVYQWGSANLYGVPGSETYVGSGTIDIAQVQLCAGSVALPFMPKSYKEEVDACDRYCQAYTSSAVSQVMAMGTAANTTDVQVAFPLRQRMRTVPTLTATATDWQVNSTAAAVDVTSMSLLANYTSENRLLIVCVTGGTLTQFRPYNLVSDGSANRTFYLEAEL